MYNIIMIKIKLSYLNMYQNEKFQRRTAILSVQDCTLLNVPTWIIVWTKCYTHKLLKYEYNALLGWVVSEDQLKEVATESGVLDVNDDFLTPQFRQACERVIPTPADVDPRDVQNAFIYLKQNIMVDSEWLKESCNFIEKTSSQ